MFVGANELDTEFVQDAALVEGKGRIEGRLSAKGGQNGVGAFLFHYGRQRLGLNRLDIGGIRHGRISHDGGRIGIDKNDGVAFFFEGFDSLGPRIVKFAALAYHDGAGADDKDLVQVSAFWHEHSLWLRCCAGCWAVNSAHTM